MSLARTALSGVDWTIHALKSIPVFSAILLIAACEKIPTELVLNRYEPSIYERYSAIAEVAVTAIVALFSAVFAGVRIFRMRRKNRIDTFYTDVIAIRSALGDSSSMDERAKAAQKIKALQNTAFELLVDEKLSADESFRIFISLSNDALRELSATNS